MPLGMRFVEFHVSDRDLDAGAVGLSRWTKAVRLRRARARVRARRADRSVRRGRRAARTVGARIQKTIDLARDLAPLFAWDRRLFPRGPKIVMHVGGMSPRPGGYDVEAADDRLLAALKRLDTAGVDLLLENLPPYPWYFGGRWFGHIICDSENTVRLCRESGLGLCFDTSHAALSARRAGRACKSLRAVTPYVRHLHVSDGAGTSGEGLQIGDGAVNFVALLPVLLQSHPTLIPEIWMGHHENGQPFRVALERLTEIHWASLVLRPAGRSPPASRPARADGDERCQALHHAARNRQQSHGHRVRARRPPPRRRRRHGRRHPPCLRPRREPARRRREGDDANVRPWPGRHVAGGLARPAARPHTDHADSRRGRPPRRLREP